MSSEPAMKTVAEVMIEQVSKIAKALEDLKRMGLPQDLIILYVQKKTRLAKRDIKAVFEALQDFQKEIKITSVRD